MWILFGGIAVVFTFINLYIYKAGKSYKLGEVLRKGLPGIRLAAPHTKRRQQKSAGSGEP